MALWQERTLLYYIEEIYRGEGKGDLPRKGEGEVVGALFYAPSYQPSPDGILIHFNSQDIEDTLSKVLDKGGKIIIPKTKIEAENKG